MVAAKNHIRKKKGDEGIHMLTGLSPWPSSSMLSQEDEVAAIHSKLDQILAAYALANTPRGTAPAPSIFSMASDRQTATSAQLDTADSIMPGGKAAAGWDNAAAESRAAGSSAVSPAGRAVDDGAEMKNTSDSAADDSEPVAPTPKGVKFLLKDVSIGDQDPTADAEEADTDAPAEAPTEAHAPASITAAAAAATSQKLSKPSAWSRLRSKAASSLSNTSDSQNPAGQFHTDMPDAVKTRTPSAASAANNGGSVGDSAGQDDMAPKSAAADSASQDDVAPEPAASTAALSAEPVLPAPSMPALGAAADTEVQVASGKTDTVPVPAAKPRSSLKKMLHRVLH